jgi:hypothetical protein
MLYSRLKIAWGQVRSFSKSTRHNTTQVFDSTITNDFGMQLHNLKSALRQKRIPNHLENKSLSVILVKNPLMLRLGQGPICHQVLTRWYHVLMRQGEIFTPLLFALMPLLPIVTIQGVMPCLRTPPCACTLKHFGSIDTLVGGSFSKTTHSLFHGTFIREPKVRAFVQKPQCTMTSVPVARQSISVSARV